MAIFNSFLYVYQRVNHFLMKTHGKKRRIFPWLLQRPMPSSIDLALERLVFRLGSGSCRHHVTSLKGTAQVDRRVEHLENIGDISFVFITRFDIYIYISSIHNKQYVMYLKYPGTQFSSFLGNPIH